MTRLFTKQRKKKSDSRNNLLNSRNNFLKQRFILPKPRSVFTHQKKMRLRVPKTESIIQKSDFQSVFSLPTNQRACISISYNNNLFFGNTVFNQQFSYLICLLHRNLFCFFCIGFGMYMNRYGNCVIDMLNTLSKIFKFSLTFWSKLIAFFISKRIFCNE